MSNPFQRESQLEKRWNGIKRDLRILFTVLPHYVKPHQANFFTSLLGAPSEWLFQIKDCDHKTISAKNEGNYHELLWLLESAFYRKRLAKIIKYLFLIFGGVFPQAGVLLWCWRNYPSEILIPSKRTPLKADEKWFFTNGICTDYDLACYDTVAIADTFLRDVTLLHTPTYGVTCDMLEVVAARTLNINCGWTAYIRKKLLKAIMDPSYNKVVIITHSRGSLTTAQAIKFMIKFATDKERRAIERKLEVYNFGNVSDEFAYVNEGPHYENYGNLLDVVADLGSLVLPLISQYSYSWNTPKRYRMTEKFYSITDKPYPLYFIHKDPKQLGHLFAGSYLVPFLKDSYIEKFKGTQERKSRLYNYYLEAINKNN